MTSTDVYGIRTVPNVYISDYGWCLVGLRAKLSDETSEWGVLEVSPSHHDLYRKCYFRDPKEHQNILDGHNVSQIS